MTLDEALNAETGYYLGNREIIETNPRTELEKTAEWIFKTKEDAYRSLTQVLIEEIDHLKQKPTPKNN